MNNAMMRKVFRFGAGWTFVFLFLLALLAGIHPARAQNALVINGQAYAQIVISPTPSRMTQLAAKELQTYIKKMTDVELAIVSQPNMAMVHVYVGPSSYTAFHGIDVSGLNDGAFRMVAGYNWLALVGRDQDFTPIEPWGHNRHSAERNRVRAEWDVITGEKYESPFSNVAMNYFAEENVWEFDEAGTLNAVHEFLRSLGVRWYAPGDLGEVVPRPTEVMLPLLDETITPDFAVRDFKIYYAHEGLEALAPWKLRLGATPGAGYIGSTQPGHGVKFVLGRPEFKAAHPEAYALKADGVTREMDGDGIPCLSSGTFFAKHVKYVQKMFDHYGEKVVSIDMPDGFGSHVCKCAACVAQFTPERGANGKLSDYVWNYLNSVAEAVYLTHPDRKVSGLAYNAYQLPPSGTNALSPNLMVIECRWRSNFHNATTKQYYQTLRGEWLARLPSQQYAVWDYYLHSRPDMAAIPAVFPRLIAADLADLHGESKGDTIEVYNNQDPEVDDYPAFSLNHLNMYVTSRCWWDADLNVTDLLEEYYTLFYGPARDEMKAFLEYCETNWMKMRTDATYIDGALTRLTAARNAALPLTSVYSKRIEKIATQYVQPMETLRASLARNPASLPSYRILEWKDLTVYGTPHLHTKTLDGNLDPTYWPATRVATMGAMAGSGTTPNTTFQMLTENNVIYLGVKCMEPNMAGVTNATLASGDPAIVNGDFISVIFETPTRSYYEILVNPAGAVLEIDHGAGGAPGWLSGAQIAVHQGTDRWSVEFRIPIMGEGARVIDAEAGIDGNLPRQLAPWYFNVARQRVQGGVVTKRIHYPGSPATFRSPVNLDYMYVK